MQCFVRFLTRTHCFIQLAWRCPSAAIDGAMDSADSYITHLLSLSACAESSHCSELAAVRRSHGDRAQTQGLPALLRHAIPSRSHRSTCALRRHWHSVTLHASVTGPAFAASHSAPQSTPLSSTRAVCPQPLLNAGTAQRVQNFRRFKTFLQVCRPMSNCTVRSVLKDKVSFCLQRL